MRRAVIPHGLVVKVILSTYAPGQSNYQLTKSILRSSFTYQLSSKELRKCNPRVPILFNPRVSILFRHQFSSSVLCKGLCLSLEEEGKMNPTVLPYHVWCGHQLFFFVFPTFPSLSKETLKHWLPKRKEKAGLTPDSSSEDCPLEGF